MPSVAITTTVTRATDWTNPFGLSPKLQVNFPLGMQLGATLNGPPTGMVPTLIGFTGGLSGIVDDRYKTKMSLYSTFVINVADPLKSVFLLNATNLALGRILYTMGLHLVASTFASFLDILDTCSVELFLISYNMAISAVTPFIGSPPIQPGIHLRITNANFFNLIKCPTSNIDLNLLPPGLDVFLSVNSFSLGGLISLSGPSSQPGTNPLLQLRAISYPPEFLFKVSGSMRVLLQTSDTYMVATTSGFQLSTAFTVFGGALMINMTSSLALPAIFSASIWKQPASQIIPSLLAALPGGSFYFGISIKPTDFATVLSNLIRNVINGLATGLLNVANAAAIANDLAQKAFSVARSALDSAQNAVNSAKNNMNQAVENWKNQARAAADSAWNTYTGYKFVCSGGPACIVQCRGDWSCWDWYNHLGWCVEECMARA